MTKGYEFWSPLRLSFLLYRTMIFVPFFLIKTPKKAMRIIKRSYDIVLLPSFGGTSDKVCLIIKGPYWAVAKTVSPV